jgi:DNA-binding CsgD family transcriptional regulator
VGITKEEQISQRQAKVLELSAQGLTEYEIVGEFSKMGVDISQKTISNDLASDVGAAGTAAIGSSWIPSRYH